MGMKIALVFARAELRRGTRIKHFMVPPYSFQLISSLTPAAYDLTIIDEYHRPADPALQADLIGIGIWTASAVRGYALADAYRRRGIRVVLGGPHITVCPEEAAAHADAIVIGEAETVWGQILQDAEAGKLRPVYNGRPIGLDDAPFADWSRIRRDDYVIGSVIATTRGCTRRCDFCYESCRPKPSFRCRPLARVLEEIDRRPDPVIAFIDNDITAQRDYARSLFTALVSRRKRWLGMTSIAVADDERLLDLMAESGCRSLFIGFESIDPGSLREVHKGCNRVETYRRNVERIHDRGIMVNGSFVFGFDHDTPGVFDRTVDFGIDACLDTATFTILTPYPGTTLYERLDREGRIFDRDWSHYDTTRVVFSPARMTREELEAGYFRAYKRFYSWAAIDQRCRRHVAGYAKRLFLNIAYKRVEPLYQFLGSPLPVGKLRFLFNWYSRPFSVTAGGRGILGKGRSPSPSWSPDVQLPETRERDQAPVIPTL